jgi:hypothetical protein
MFSVGELLFGEAVVGAHARTGPRFGKTLTEAEVLALPAVVDLETANRALGIGRSTGYRWAKAGEYPCRVIQLPTGYRVVSADLQSLVRSKEKANADGSDAVQQDAA